MSPAETHACIMWQMLWMYRVGQQRDREPDKHFVSCHDGISMKKGVDKPSQEDSMLFCSRKSCLSSAWTITSPRASGGTQRREMETKSGFRDPNHSFTHVAGPSSHWGLGNTEKAAWPAPLHSGSQEALKYLNGYPRLPQLPEWTLTKGSQTHAQRTRSKKGTLGKTRSVSQKTHPKPFKMYPRQIQHLSVGEIS